jgi:hypothetical protein
MTLTLVAGNRPCPAGRRGPFSRPGHPVRDSYALRPEARARISSVYLTSIFFAG